ncbi:hypothetical protein [Candidatus Solirubrobacter pratensis]|uniref:hypothetical protein n=1 Tax=Candidatus Solirubrobacter pratensis TaxID=1298857 RepID=UPI0004805470|nr:hypothetical protein [Candidatus Solirubrobacter pratensis]
MLAAVAVLCIPVSAHARPNAAGCPTCAKVQFVQHISWKRFNAEYDSRVKNPIVKPGVKSRLKAYARQEKDKFAGCNDNAFMKKVCRAAKACLAAGGFALYAGVAHGQNAWQAERDATTACIGAIVGSLAS